VLTFEHLDEHDMPTNPEMHVLYNPLYTSTATAVVEREVYKEY